MENQIEIIKEIADSMIGIGGVPSNEDFYVEFNSRVIARLGIKTELIDFSAFEFRCSGFEGLNSGLD